VKEYSSIISRFSSFKTAPEKLVNSQVEKVNV